MNARFHIAKLKAGETTQFRPHGNSMLPIIKSGQLLTFAPVKDDLSDVEIGDIVLCKVKGRIIDAHLVTKKGTDGRFMISNNHGHDNGWTRTIYGKVIKIED